MSKGFKVTIPAKYRKQLEIKEEDKIAWFVNDHGNLELKKMKTYDIKDLIGLADSEEETNAVEIKRKAQNRM